MSHEELRHRARPLPPTWDTCIHDVSAAELREVFADLDDAARDLDHACREVGGLLLEVAAKRAEIDRLVALANSEYARGFAAGQRAAQPFIPGVYPWVAPRPSIAPPWPGHWITVNT